MRVLWLVVLRTWKNGWRTHQLLKADADAEYTKVYEIDLADIKEPILCCPNDPDDAKLLSDVQGAKLTKCSSVLV